jgi:hypothetical protein
MFEVEPAWHRYRQRPVVQKGRSTRSFSSFVAVIQIGAPQIATHPLVVLVILFSSSASLCPLQSESRPDSHHNFFVFIISFCASFAHRPSLHRFVSNDLLLLLLLDLLLIRSRSLRLALVRSIRHLFLSLSHPAHLTSPPPPLSLSLSPSHNHQHLHHPSPSFQITIIVVRHIYRHSTLATSDRLQKIRLLRSFTTFTRFRFCHP